MTSPFTAQRSIGASQKPRPWQLTGVKATKDAQGRPAVEIEFDETAAEALGRLTEDNKGRALAVLFDDKVVLTQIIGEGTRNKLILSGSSIDEKRVPEIVRSLRECMVSRPACALIAVEQALEPLFAKLDPKATMEYEDQSLIMTYKPQNFKVHGQNREGNFSKEAHDEVGPSYEGIVLKVHLQSLGEINSAGTPQTLRRPYWKTSLDVTPLGKSDKQIYWGLSYGSRVDQKLLEQIGQQLRDLAK